jgi:hypothetical protein
MRALQAGFDPPLVPSCRVAGRGSRTDWAHADWMEEPVTYCVGSCRGPILDRDAPGIRPVERIVEMPQGFGGRRDLKWRPA